MDESDDGDNNIEVANDKCEDRVKKTNQLELDQGEVRKVRGTVCVLRYRVIQSDTK